MQLTEGLWLGEIENFAQKMLTLIFFKSLPNFENNNNFQIQIWNCL